MQSAIPFLLSLFYNPRYDYPDSFDQMRARATLLYSTLAMVAAILTLLVALVAKQPLTFTNWVILGTLLILLLQPVIIGLIHAGRLQIAIVLTFELFMAGSLLSLTDGVSTSAILALSIPLLYGALLWEWRGVALTLFLDAVAIIAVGLLQANHVVAASQVIPRDQLLATVAIDLFLILVVGLLSGLVAGELRRALRYTTRLVAQLRATSEVAQQAAKFTDPIQLLRQTADYVRDRFGFYHVQIFLIDAEQRFATLQASTGDSGEALLQRGYRVAVGSQGLIGQVTLLGEPLTARIDHNEEVVPSRGAELLPETRSELALPLIARDRILGVLDIQSARPNAFQPQDVESLSIMAAHISIAVNNAQLFQEQRAALNENRRLFLEAETNLRETQLLNQRLTGEAWADYLRTRNADVIGYTLTNNQLRHDETWSPTLQDAVDKRQPIISNDGGRQVIGVPVELRGRPIGAIEVETSGTGRQSDTVEMLQSIAQRLALSIDNARLFEQAQELAQQELEVNAISARLQSTTNITEIVKTAVSELSRALGAQQASIRLGLDLAEKFPPIDIDSRSNGHTSAQKRA